MVDHTRLGPANRQTREASATSVPAAATPNARVVKGSQRADSVIAFREIASATSSNTISRTAASATSR